MLYKGSGSPLYPASYRGINLQNDFLRIFERLTKSRLHAWAEEVNAFRDFQFGFRGRRSTSDAVMALRALVSTATISFQKSCYVAFIDLRKAISSIDRQAVIDLLYELNCPRKLTSLLNQSFQLNSARLKNENFLSRIIQINKGTREGGINSPDLFCIAFGAVLKKLGVLCFPRSMSDMCPTGVYALAYADDLALISMNVSSLRDKLLLFVSLIKDFGMEINVSKTKLMTFQPKLIKMSLPPTLLSLNGEAIENVPSFKYLGFHFDDTLSFDPHVSSCCSKLNVAAKRIGSILHNLQVTNLHVLRMYFNAFVSSQLYGQEQLSFDSELFLRAQADFLRCIFCSPTAFPMVIAQSLLSIPPLPWSQVRRFEGFKSRVSVPIVSFTASHENPVRHVLEWDIMRIPKHQQAWEFERVMCLSGLVPEPELVQASGLEPERLLQLLVNKTQESMRLKLTDGLSPMLSLFPDCFVSPNFQKAFGLWDFEIARLMVLFFGNCLCWSVFVRPTRECPFCHGSLHSEHFFSCHFFPPTTLPIPDWLSVIEIGRRGEWNDFKDSIITMLRSWYVMSGTFKEELHEFLFT